MRKLLLLAAGAFMAISANAQTIVWEWKHETNVPTANDCRYCTGYNGELIMANKTTGCVEFWNANGKMTKSYDVNTWLTENGVENKLGLGAAVDDAGNIICPLGFGGSDNTQFVIIRADGSDMKHVTVEITNPGTKGRMDYLGNAIGDVYGDYGWIFLTSNASQHVTAINFYQGEQDVDYSYSVANGLGANFDATAIATSVDDGNTDNPTIYFRKRGNANIYVSEAMGDCVKSAATFNKNASNDGFDVFKLNGTIYCVVPAVDASGARSDSFEVRNIATDEVVASYTIAGSQNQQSAYSTEVNNDGTVSIYQLNVGRRVAKYLFALDEGLVSGVEEIGVDANAPVEYYNLQGVKVANPESGLFIKKQGSKTTKVVL